MLALVLDGGTREITQTLTSRPQSQLGICSQILPSRCANALLLSSECPWRSRAVHIAEARDRVDTRRDICIESTEIPSWDLYTGEGVVIPGSKELVPVEGYVEAVAGELSEDVVGLAENLDGDIGTFAESGRVSIGGVGGRDTSGESGEEGEDEGGELEVGHVCSFDWELDANCR